MLAQSEMAAQGVPASIKLAQGILESNSGRSELALKARNHFGIKCGSAWTGPTFGKEDDDYNADGDLIKSCFRVYPSPEQSYRDHSQFLKKPRYSKLFKLNIKDYKGWARGLKEAGYATNPKYPQLLINLIERHQLYKYDDVKYTPPTDPVTDVPPLVVEIHEFNRLKAVYAEAGDNPQTIAKRYKVDVSKVMKYNETQNPKRAFEKGERVFLQKKRRKYRGDKKYHLVKPGESMYNISQLYGIRLKYLYKKNRMNRGRQPAPGARVAIKRKAKSTPKLLPKGQHPDKPTISPTPPVKPPKITPPPKPDVEETNTTYHTVSAGETLYAISRKYDIPVSEIKKANNLDSDIISIGQQLIIPRK